MSVAKIEDQEGELLNVLQDASPLEWRKYQQKNPNVWKVDHFEKEDRSSFPPFISFRFIAEDNRLLDMLKRLVSSYQGKVSWVLYEHKRENLPGRNWTIAPARLAGIREDALKMGISSGQFLAREDPNFGPIAYEDLIGLTLHVKNNLFR